MNITFQISSLTLINAQGQAAHYIKCIQVTVSVLIASSIMSWKLRLNSAQYVQFSFIAANYQIVCCKGNFEFCCLNSRFVNGRHD